MHWMILPFKRYADFTGRSRRMEYWMFTLLNVLLIALLWLVVFGTAGLSNMADPGADPNAYAALFGGAGLLILIYVVAIIIPSIAVTVRRLHDRNLSGWWYLASWC